jgi:L-aminopeptidase/D-esterase-like protein
MRPGKRNNIADVAGIAVGNAEDQDVRTGVTVVLPDRPAVAAVDLRGGAPGTRETDLLDPSSLVEKVDAVVLSGGSAHGLDAASAVMATLTEMGIGFEVGAHRVPIVPGAILFDLANGGDKSWGPTPPYRRLGAVALAAAGRDFDLGNAGAGYGATAGTLKGGLGSASCVTEDEITVGALAAVNSLGEVTLPESPHFWAWPFEVESEFGGLGPPRAPPALTSDLSAMLPGTSTTLAVVATDATLSPTEARRLAVMAQVGLARAIRPSHTPFDGDLVFAMATGRRPLSEPARDLARLGMVAADCLTRAVARGVYEARSIGNIAAYNDRFPPGRERKMES